MPRNRHPLSVEDLWAIKRIGTPTISPDGRTACAAVTSYDMEKNEGSTELWLFPTDARKPRRLTAGDKDSDPVWSPDGKWIAFAAKRKDDEEPQVYLIAPDGGEARRLTSIATGASGLRWFPDSRRIAFISWVWPDLKTDQAQAKRRKERKEAKIKAHLSERSEYRFWDHWLTDGRRGGTRRLASKLDRATGHHEWAPDGSHLYLIVEDRGRHGLFRVGLDEALPSPVAPGGVIGGYALARDGTRIVFDRATLSHPPALFAMAADGRDERPIESVNRALFARVRL